MSTDRIDAIKLLAAADPAGGLPDDPADRAEVWNIISPLIDASSPAGARGRRLPRVGRAPLAGLAGTLLIGGVADTLWNPVRSELLEWVRRMTAITAGIAAVLFVVPQWGSALARQAGENGTTSSLEATAWVEQHVPRKDVVVVDDYLWLDLKRAGMNPLWEQKMGSDSESQGELSDGWRSVSYVVVTGQIIGTLATLPILQQAISHSVPVASFADGIIVRRVVAGPAGIRDYDDAAHSGDRRPRRPAAGGLHQADRRRAADASGGRAGPVHRGGH